MRRFELVELSDHRGDLSVELLGGGFLLGAFGGLDELHHHVDVAEPLVEIDDREDGALQVFELGDVRLGALVVVPEIGRAHLASIASISCCFVRRQRNLQEMAGAPLNVLDVGKGLGCDHGK